MDMDTTVPGSHKLLLCSVPTTVYTSVATGTSRYEMCWFPKLPLSPGGPLEGLNPRLSRRDNAMAGAQASVWRE